MGKDYSEHEEGFDALLDAASASAGEGAWTFPIEEQAAGLFEALPERFTFEELAEAASELGQTSEEAVRHLRTFQRLEMVFTEERFVKTGEKPYF